MQRRRVISGMRVAGGWIAAAVLFFSSAGLDDRGHAAPAAGRAAPEAAPTFTRDVAPILQRSCQRCHRATGIGPMPLETYEQTRQYARLVKQRVETRTMPPWHIDRAVGIQEFKNDVSLADAEIATIARWVDGGAPRGDPADLPPPVEHPDPADWALEDRLGPPDLVVRSTPYTVVANGQDQWWNPRVEFKGLDEERWIRAAEFKPAHPVGVKVVHHGHATLVTQNDDGARELVGLARYGVGKSWDILPDGTGIRVPPGTGRHQLGPPLFSGWGGSAKRRGRGRGLVLSERRRAGVGRRRRASVSDRRDERRAPVGPRTC